MMPDDSQIAQGPEADRERWNRKYRAKEKYRGEEAGSRGPDGLLAEACAGMAGGDALDLAGGAGRHAIWLAQQGWRVVVSDVSDEGLAVAARRAAEEGVRLELRRESAAETMAWAGSEGGRRFDLVAVFWFLERERFAALPGLLRRGGRLIYKTHTSEHVRYERGHGQGHGQGHELRFALRPGELRSAFPSLRTVVYRESDGVAELVAELE